MKLQINYFIEERIFQLKKVKNRNLKLQVLENL